MNEAKVQEIIQLMRKQCPGWSSFADADFVKEEVEYKQSTIAKARDLINESELRRLLLSAQYDEIIQRLDKLGRDNNLLYRSVPAFGDLGILYQPSLDKKAFCKAITNLLYGSEPVEQRLETYIQFVNEAKLPSKWTFPTYFLFLCHPDSEMFVKPTVTTWLLSFVGQDDAWTPKPSVDAYAAIRAIAHELYESLREYGPRDMVDIQGLVWVCATAQPEASGVRYWKIQPGRNIWNWQACRDGGFIAIGWDELGDISDISKEEFDRRRDEQIPLHDDWTKSGADQVWRFAHIKQGDKIIANNGHSELLGIGTVCGEYYYQADAVEHRHRLPLEWEDLTRRVIDEPGLNMTFAEVKRDKFMKLRAAPPVPDAPESEPEPKVSPECPFTHETFRLLSELTTRSKAEPKATAMSFVVESIRYLLVCVIAGCSDHVRTLKLLIAVEATA